MRGDRLVVMVGAVFAASVFWVAGDRWWSFATVGVGLFLAGRMQLVLDPVRFFSDDDRETIFTRAGGRCQWPGCGVPVHYEWQCPLGGCDFDYQADHKHPHSKGGRTVLTNGQCLCRRHNLVKSDDVPYS
jgi:hypothetical protein